MLTKLKIGYSILIVLIVATCSYGIDVNLTIYNNQYKKQKKEYILKVSSDFKEAELYIDGKNISIKNNTKIRMSEYGNLEVHIGDKDHLYFLNFKRNINGGRDLIYREKTINGKTYTIDIPSRYLIR